MRRYAFTPLRVLAMGEGRTTCHWEKDARMVFSGGRRSNPLLLQPQRNREYFRSRSSLLMIYKREGIIANGTNKRMVRIRQMLNIRFIRSLRSYSRYFHFAKRQRDCHDPARAAGSRNDDVMDVISERRALALWSYSL
jgi:hypothetical protein